MSILDLGATAHHKVRISHVRPALPTSYGVERYYDLRVWKDVGKAGLVIEIAGEVPCMPSSSSTIVDCYARC
jgi:hypothetical protein